MYCPPFLFLPILGTFLGSGLLCTAVQVRTDPARAGCDHPDNGSPLSEAHKGPMQAGTWCPQARVRGGLSIREEPWALGQLLAWEPFP